MLFLLSGLDLSALAAGDRTSSEDETARVEAALRKLWPDAKIVSLAPLEGYQKAWEVSLPQPLDHKNPDGSTFPQRIYIQHKGLKKPNVLVTEGYQINNRLHEPSRMLDANQITVEYRFCGASAPQNKDWSLLNHEQALEDFHRIRQDLGKIYKKTWVCTGVSKGGTTAALYKLTYPKSVKTALAYVAPFPLAQEDPRTVLHYRQQAGTEACRQSVFEFQRHMLQQRENLIPLVEELARSEGVEFPLGIPATIEYAALEYPFSFWQWGARCEEIPGPNSGAKEIFDHIEEIVDFNFYDQKSYEQYQPAFYQFMSEFGYYGFDTTGLSDLLVYEKSPSNLKFCPRDVPVRYQAGYMQRMQDLATRKGKKILYVYGALDTWTSCGIVPAPGLKALRLVHPRGGHRTKIRDFPEEERALAIRTLRKWTGIKKIKSPK